MYSHLHFKSDSDHLLFKNNLNINCEVILKKKNKVLQHIKLKQRNKLKEFLKNIITDKTKTL